MNEIEAEENDGDLEEEDSWEDCVDTSFIEEHDRNYKLADVCILYYNDLDYKIMFF